MNLKSVFANPLAHRGLHNLTNGIAENSRTAFERAMKGGYGIECDLQLSGDGVPMVFHDSDLKRLTGQDGPISTLSAGQLGRIMLAGSKAGDCPQTFAELLEQTDGHVPLVVELKHQGDGRNADLARAAAEAVKDYKGVVAFKSFDPGLIRSVRKADFWGPVGIVTCRFDDAGSKKRLSAAQRFVFRHLLHRFKFKFDFISCDKDALTLPAVGLLHNSGVPLMSWTVRSYDEESAARRLADQIVFEGYLPHRG